VKVKVKVKADFSKTDFKTWFKRDFKLVHWLLDLSSLGEFT
jgi:hypothetical protein